MIASVKLKINVALQIQMCFFMSFSLLLLKKNHLPFTCSFSTAFLIEIVGNQEKNLNYLGVPTFQHILNNGFHY